MAHVSLLEHLTYVATTMMTVDTEEESRAGRLRVIGDNAI